MFRLRPTGIEVHGASPDSYSSDIDEGCWATAEHKEYEACGKPTANELGLCGHHARGIGVDATTTL